MAKVDYSLILSKKFPGKQWVLDGDNYDGLTWLDDSPKPSKKILDDLWDVVLNEIDADNLAKAAAKSALLNRLGLTENEAKLLLS